VALFVKLAYVCAGDWHPVLYQQRRIGFRGEPFQLYKFRSMVWDADKALEDILKDPEARAEWERDQKLSNDPRITPIGRFLRRTSIDELPQFLNVLIGQMSLVGPRPLVPGELEEHHGKALYNKVKPGITGWWGCNGRSNIDYRERLELEYYYIKHCSLYLDVVSIMRTCVTVLKRDGAQ
jgi:undecaprenyl-phosphate galactose phosphotransferase